MSYNVISIRRFDKQVKRLVRKFPSLKKELSFLIESLENNPFFGTPLGHHCFKIRLAIESKGKGKSGGARVITHIYIKENVIYLLSIYDKSEQSGISEDEILNLLAEIK